jgi:peptidoglycan/LPS O-acetylase OafA/YrhL
MKNLRQTQAGTKRRHFETLDAMRFFAFFCVFLGHANAIPFLDFFQHSAGLAVQFFFTLSGFLITYIILEEKEQTGKLNLKNFFIRRILRIWPLFYLAILVAWCTPFILSFLHLPYSNEGYEPNWLMSVCFLENYKFILEQQLPNVSPLAVMWSLCVEEHFYIVWGLALFFLKTKNSYRLFIASIFIAPVSRLLFIEQNWETVDLFTNIDFFAYGAIPAFLLITKKEKFEKRINQIPLIYKYLSIILVISLFFILSHYKFSNNLAKLLIPSLFGILFMILIVIIIPQENKIKIGKKNIFSRLGKYTYGLYIYHALVISLFLSLFNRFDWGGSTFLTSLISFALSLLCTIIISIFSYNLFEVKFLDLKKRF